MKASLQKSYPGYLELVNRELKQLLPDQEVLDAGVRVFTYFALQKQTAMDHLPMGTAVEVAVYSDSFTHVSVMRKVLIRMKSWQNYLYLDH